MKHKICILFVFALCMQISFSQNLTVGTYNVRYDNEHDILQGNGWKQRCPVVLGLITFNDFDIFGAQEVLHNQLNDMLEGLSQYDYIGVGRDDGKTKGEYAPIFFKKNKIELLKSGHFWLSNETTYPNKGWDAALPRICTWGNFKEKTKGTQFWFFNLHMDHVGVEARKESAKLVLSKIKEMCGNAPVILTGDFNVDQTHESYDLLANSNLLFDSYKTAKVQYALNGTFNAWDINNFTTSRIDHIFVSKRIQVNYYGILTDSYRMPVSGADEKHEGDFPKEVKVKSYVAKLPSDHFPVKVLLNF